RQELLVLYCELTAKSDEQPSEALQKQFERLCEVVMDYVSAGHFEIYEQLIREADEFNDGGRELAAKLYPRLQQTTEQVLDFNDCLDGKALSGEQLGDLFVRLSNLGETLE